MHREVLTRPPAWGRSFWRNASYEEGGAGRPRQSVTAWPPGESDGGGAQKPEKTLPGPLALAAALDENIPRPIHHGGWGPRQALRGEAHPVSPGLPSKGRPALLGLC